MKLTTGVRMLRLLNTRPENALTTGEISRRWRDLGARLPPAGDAAVRATLYGVTGIALAHGLAL